MHDDLPEIPAPKLTLCQQIKELLKYHNACAAHFADNKPRRIQHEAFIATLEQLAEKACKREPKPKDPPPTVYEVLLFASEVSLPESEARKFYHHFEANGWKMNGKAKVKNWRARLQLWKEHWLDRENKPGRGGAQVTDFSSGGF